MIEKLTRSERRVLEHFVDNPGEEIHVRGLSDQIDLSYATVRSSLEKLDEEGLLQSDENSKMKFYSTAGKKFRDMKKVVNLEKLLDSGIVEFIEEKLRPEAIVLFGSYLEGRDDQESDIDIAVIEGKNRDIGLKKFEKDLNRKISLTTIQSIEEENREFKNTLANGYTISGFIEVE